MASYAKFFSIGSGGGEGGLALLDNALMTGTLTQVVDKENTPSVLRISTTDITNYGGGADSSNTAFGGNALVSNTVGYQNTALGSQALSTNIDGFNNTALGYNSMRDNDYGLHNTAVGTNSLLKNISGSTNTAVGYFSLSENLTGQSNTAVGVFALDVNLSDENSAFGYGALGSNTSGNSNTAVGTRALNVNSTGSSNSGFGWNALRNVTTGSNNTGLGYNTGWGITTGSGNTILGANVGGLSPSLTNTVIISNGTNNQRIVADFNGLSYASGSFASIGDFEASIILAKSLATLSSGGTTELLLDGGNLIIPSGTNRLWAAKITSSAFVSVAGGAPLIVGDSYMVETNILIKKVGGITSIVGVNAGNAIYDINMQTSFFNYTIGASQNLLITFNAPSTATSTTFRCASKIEIVESAF